MHWCIVIVFGSHMQVCLFLFLFLFFSVFNSWMEQVYLHLHPWMLSLTLKVQYGRQIDCQMVATLYIYHHKDIGVCLSI